MDVDITSESMDLTLWAMLGHLKNAALGTVSVGLLIGAIYFTFYLLRLSRLPKNCREYRELSYHMES